MVWPAYQHAAPASAFTRPGLGCTLSCASCLYGSRPRQSREMPSTARRYPEKCASKSPKTFEDAPRRTRGFVRWRHRSSVDCRTLAIRPETEHAFGVWRLQSGMCPNLAASLFHSSRSSHVHSTIVGPIQRDAAREASARSGSPSLAHATNPSGRTSTAVSPRRSLAWDAK